MDLAEKIELTLASRWPKTTTPWLQRAKRRERRFHARQLHLLQAFTTAVCFPNSQHVLRINRITLTTERPSSCPYLARIGEVWMVSRAELERLIVLGLDEL